MRVPIAETKMLALRVYGGVTVQTRLGAPKSRAFFCSAPLTLAYSNRLYLLP